MPGPTPGDTETPRSDPEGKCCSSTNVRRARGEPEQNLSGVIPTPSADETLTLPEIPAVPSGFDSVEFNFNSDPGASSISG